MVDFVDGVDVAAGVVDQHPDDVEPHLYDGDVERRTAPDSTAAVQNVGQNFGSNRLNDFLEKILVERLASTKNLSRDSNWEPSDTAVKKLKTSERKGGK